jgi:hypothetical protein
MKIKMCGITLMELTIAISMSLLVLAGLGAVFAGALKVWSKVQDSTNALKTGQIAMGWISRDIKEGVILDAKQDEIKLSGDVSYSLAQNILYRNSDALAKDISKINFSYYNKNGNVESDIGNIAFVSFSITVKDKNHELILNNGAGIRNKI